MAKKRKRNSLISNRQEGKRVTEKADAEFGLPSFADLPIDITTNILLRLPIKSLLICKCVCKSWNTLVSDPQFAKLQFERAPVGVLIRTNDPKRVSRTLRFVEYEHEMFDCYNHGKRFCCCEETNIIKPECKRHIKLEPKFKLPLRDAKLVLTERYEIDNGGRKRTYIACKPRDDKFSVVNSCNGLLCLCDPRYRDPLVVSNPVTGEFIRLPPATRIEKMKNPIRAGFGFDPKTNEYKVLRICRRYIKHPHHVREWMYDGIFAEMHTLGTSTWKNIGGDLERFSNVLTFPTCVNGALHWLTFDVWDWARSILCFNFESERLQPFPPPPVFKENGCSIEYTSMGELKGLLYICDASSYDYVKMWEMKKYGVGESWSMVFCIGALFGRWPYGLYWPVKLFKGGDVLMYHPFNCFIYYEHKKCGFKYFKVRGTTQSYKFEAIPHIPSLISLKDVVKGENVEMLNVHSR
ncbi:hypothetical protein RIF29_17944 [Crotalaria pallida]|uniref:F-box domain-containing protein n=1 Tax=Crotalaria pallida TaxID=3830 RepID=A0AAN9FRS7_CROPI